MEYSQNQLPYELTEALRTKSITSASQGYWRFKNPSELQSSLPSHSATTNMIPFAISVFGDIMVWDQDAYVKVVQSVIPTAKMISSGCKFLLSNMEDSTYQDEYFDMSLYKIALSKLGPISSEECYGCMPIPALGGSFDAEHLEICKWKEYLAICNLMK